MQLNLNTGTPQRVAWEFVDLSASLMLENGLISRDESTRNGSATPAAPTGVFSTSYTAEPPIAGDAPVIVINLEGTPQPTTTSSPSPDPTHTPGYLVTSNLTATPAPTVPLPVSGPDRTTDNVEFSNAMRSGKQGADAPISMRHTSILPADYTHATRRSDSRLHHSGTSSGPSPHVRPKS